MASATICAANEMPGEVTEIAIQVNAEPQNVRAATLADVLAELGYAGQKVATAVNGDFVPERLRGETAIVAGDRVEVLSARQGG